jgi:hypothetical protein
VNAAVLVTGIHREELGFGDRVAALVDPEQVEVLRIARGISNSRIGTGDQFYSDTEHREIYLQLRQQLRQQPLSRGSALIDLHAGVDEQAPCADIYLASETLLSCLEQVLGPDSRVRLVRITDKLLPDHETRAGALARTRIPRCLWESKDWLYVGLEIYLAQPGDGRPEDWGFASDLVGHICRCAAAALNQPSWALP